MSFHLHPSKLSHLIRAAKRSPFYKAKLAKHTDISSYEAWKDLPITNKSDMRHSYPFGFLAIDFKAVASYHESSGTSGLPTSSFFSASDWQVVANSFLQNAIGLDDDDTVLIKTPYSLVTTAHQMHQAAKMAGATIVPADNRSSNMDYPKVIRLLRDLAITVTWSLPSEVALWAACAMEMGLDPAKDFSSIRAFWVAGEPLSRSKQQMLEELWGGKKIYQDYGSTETGSLAGDCSSGHLHLWSEHFLFEILDPRKKTTSLTGRGQLLITSLSRSAMPLVRYNTEDEVEICPKHCPCGDKRPRIKIFGRSQTQVKIGSHSIYQSDIEDVIFSLRDPASTLFWRAQACEDHLRVQIYKPLRRMIDPRTLGPNTVELSTIEASTIEASTIEAKILEAKHKEPKFPTPSQVSHMQSSASAPEVMAVKGGSYQGKTKPKFKHIHLETSEAKTKYHNHNLFLEQLTSKLQKKLGVSIKAEIVPNFLPENIFSRAKRFQKPKYLYAKHEDWSESVVY